MRERVLEFFFFFYIAEVTEGALLRDLIFVFQNINGQYIQFDSHQDAFRLSNKVSYRLRNDVSTIIGRSIYTTTHR